MPIALKHYSGIGIVLGFGCAFMFSIGSLMVKILNMSARQHPIYLATIRQTMVMFLAGPQVAYCKASYVGERVDWPYLVLRSFSGGVAICLSFISFSYLPLPDAGVLLATTPTFTTLFGLFFLKEKCHISDVPVLAVTLLGVIFISRPVIIFQFIAPGIVDEVKPIDRLIGSAIALSGAIIQSGVYIAFRKLRHANYATISFTYGLISFPILWIVVFALGIFSMPPSYLDRTMAIGIGATAAGAQALMTVSSKFVPAGIVSLMRSTETVFNFFWQVLFLGGTVNPFSIVGCILVSLSISFLSVRTIITQKYKSKDASENSKFINFLLLIFR